MNTDLKVILENVGKRKVPDFKKYIELEVSGNTSDDIDAIMPSVRY